MNEQERDEFLKQPYTAVLSTIGKNGRIHAIPVWYLWRDGTFRITTEKRAQKVRNIERTGRASLCIDDRSPGSVRYITVEGPVEIEFKATPEQRLELWRQYRGEDAARLMAATVDNTPNACWLVLTPEHWIG